MNDERFHRGIAEFNAHRFFEAHDVLEELWHEYREDDRRFLQGLIQLAVGYYHLENWNYHGCRSLLRKAVEKLLPYAPAHQGILVENLVDCASHCLRLVNDLQPGERVDIPPHVIPTISYSKSP